MTVPDPPRPLSPTAARRAWTEPTVRPWWLIAAVVMVAAVGYVIAMLVEVVPENRRVTRGTAVMAMVERTVAHQIAGQSADAGDNVNVSFIWHGERHTSNGWLTRSTVVKATIPIRVDPGDPAKWTDRTEPTPLLPAMVVGLLALPLVPVLLAVAWARRQSVARTYRRGRSAVAIVNDRRTVPIAPLSYAVRCRLRDADGDRRLHTVYVPHAAGRPLAKGDAVWDHPPRRPRPTRGGGVVRGVSREAGVIPSELPTPDSGLPTSSP